MKFERLFVTILDGSTNDIILDLSSFQKERITFGRAEDNDIVLTSSVVSKHHGSFRYQGGHWRICDEHSTNGIFQNGERLEQKQLVGGDKLLIGYESTSKKVTFVFSQNSPQNVYRKYTMPPGKTITIGRSKDCEVQLDHVSVLKRHCIVTRTDGGVYLERASSAAPVQYNNTNMPLKQKLSDMDRFLIGDTQFFFSNNTLHYIKIAEGLCFEVSHLSKIVGKGKRINDDVSFSVNAGEFVAIIGGSGAGKSTLMNCLCGSSAISEGYVTVDGEDLTSNYSSLKNLIGYVPQQDIVYDGLTLYKMLYYAAKLRMPDDSGAEEIRQRIDQSLEYVELEEKKDLLIRKLSGGQKKRASIAVELLSDPKLFFLDEPTSGLDPGTERNLMETLKKMSRRGKTVVLVTHTPLNLSMCDKIVVMGSGGRLCFCGSPDAALDFFGVADMVDVYDLINNNAEYWSSLYKQGHTGSAKVQTIGNASRGNDVRHRVSSFRQLRILMRRYAELLTGDLRRLLIQLLMAPGLGVLLYIAFRDSFPFQTSGDTQKLALTLACCAFWIGLFNTIQEICRESRIYRRERMSSLRLAPYIGSKLTVNALLDLVQSLLLLGTVSILLAVPEAGMQFPDHPWLELFITTYLTMFSATCIGLMVSAAVNDPGQATSAAPILLIPQILFSGVVVTEMTGIVDSLSRFMSCRHACIAYCTTSDINNLPSEFKLTALGYEAGEVAPTDSIYSYADNVNSVIEKLFGSETAQAISNPVVSSWVLLIALSAAAILLSLVFLKLKDRRQ